MQNAWKSLIQIAKQATERGTTIPYQAATYWMQRKGE